MKKAILLSLLLATASFLAAQETIKIMHYNILQYGNTCGSVSISSKNAWLNTITAYYQPDILTVNEMADNVAYANNIRTNALLYRAMEYADLTNNTNSSIVNMLFYDPAKFGYEGVQVIGGNLRDVNVYRLYTQASATSANSDTVFLNCIVAHFKAGNSSGDASQRRVAAEAVMNWIENHPDENYLLLGDLNIYSSNEDAFQELVFNSNTSLRLQDLSGYQSGWGGFGGAAAHTQSTRSNSPDCGSGGGMDDRFDFILVSEDIENGTNGATYVADSYLPFGNDGSSYNQELDCSDNQPVPSVICNNLRQMSDHLPVVMEIETRTDNVSIEALASALSGVSVRLLGNPVQENLNLDIWYEESGKTYQLEILNLMGESLYSQELQAVRGKERLEIPVAHLASGIYLMRIRANGKQVVQRFIK